jgi:hypothetical protein
LVTGCADYLDIVPDNLITVDDAFSSRSNAEKFRNTCYGYLPSIVRPFHDPSWIAGRGDEFWYYRGSNNYPDFGRGDAPMGIAIMQGAQNTNNPYLSYWDGGRDGIPLFRAIHECNIFLENVEEKNVVPDVSEEQRIWWIGEVRFLKAYYHFFLMQLYGPIPIVRRNLDLNASPDEVRVFREPIDDVVNYIVEELDEAVKYLDNDVVDSDGLMYGGGGSTYTNGGRITKSIALAVKAKVLVWAASPLFNGNDFYTDFIDSRGKQLIPSGAPDVNKWKRAATACKEAIDEIARKGFYALLTRANSNEIGRHGDISPATQQKYILRYAVTEPFNREIIWPSTHPINGYAGWDKGSSSDYWIFNLERESMPGFHYTGTGNAGHNGSQGTTLKMAEQFYTSNGLPIDEDSDWQQKIGGYVNRYGIGTAPNDGYHDYYINWGATTAQLNLYREPRFYSYLGFDGGIWEGLGKSESESYVVNKRTMAVGDQVPTGYYMKKVVHPQSSFVSTGSITYNFVGIPYTFPYMRLADLYLLYAEALNESVEAETAVPDDVYFYVDEVRKRAGLKGVKETWSQSMSLNKTKPDSKTGMRSIIRRERTVELCFEGKRTEDIRRWRIAHEEFNQPIRGWNGISPYTNPGLASELPDEVYYQVTEHYSLPGGYAVRDYFWPVKSDDMIVNSNLIQSPGW